MFIYHSQGKTAMENLGLELLVRQGNFFAVKQFATEKGIDQATEDAKIAEANIYHFHNQVGRFPGEIFGPQIQNYFNTPLMTDYLSTTNNSEILRNLLDSDSTGFDAGLSILMGVDLLSNDNVYQALRRNISNVDVNTSVTKFAESAYSWILSLPSTGRDLGTMFNTVDQFRDLVNAPKLAENAIRNYQDQGIDDLGKERVYFALSKLIEMTDISTVSKLCHKHLEGKDYDLLVKDEIINAYTDPSEVFAGVNKATFNAVQAYGSDWYVAASEVAKMDDKMYPGHIEYVARKMGDWFEDGKIQHITELAKYEGGRLYNHTVAQNIIGEKIANAWDNSELAKLTLAFQLPENLIDLENPRLADFREVYQLHHTTIAQLPE
jgi:hypothetical protein